MMVTFPDVVAEMCKVVRDGFDRNGESVEVGARIPDAHDSLPRVQIDQDSNSVNYPIVSRSTIRVTVYALSREESTDVSSLCQGIILSYQGGTIERTRSLTGPIPGYDDEAGIHFATFTVSATVHSIQK